MWIPGVPRVLAIYSYGMMAPYQTYRTFNEELIAEGRVGNGDWQKIALEPYLPFIRGERAHRSYMVSLRYRGDPVADIYANYAQTLKRLEAHRGRYWDDIRLQLEKWPMSPAGYEYLRTEPFTQHTLL